MSRCSRCGCSLYKSPHATGCLHCGLIVEHRLRHAFGWLCIAAFITSYAYLLYATVTK